jgi:SAM-dependent methyltransferase
MLHGCRSSRPLKRAILTRPSGTRQEKAIIATMERTGLPFWEAISTKFQYSPPLTPGDSDIAWYAERALGCLSKTDVPRRALLLGVTPRIVAMQWPAGTMLVPVDWSQGMIRNVLPHAADAREAIPVRGDWRELPLADSSMHAAFCDLLFPAMPSFDDGELALRELARVLRSGGGLFIRCFVRPDPEESANGLLREIAEGRAADLSVLRMRLAAAVQGASRSGVEVGQVWKVFDERFPDRAALARLYDAGPTAFETIERWRNLHLRYAFPTAAEISRLAQPHFEVDEAVFPNYAAGRLIARLALRRR